MTCTACGRGFHAECSKGKCKKCHPREENEKQSKTTERGSIRAEYQKRGRTAANLKDPHSTGRKRAVKLHPLDKDAPCEWQRKRNCGGGEYPIIGCLDGKQQDLHHGPVKDTTRNNRENVHKICKSCHIHWHEMNDLVYDAKRFSLLPHDPEDASITEVTKNIIQWKSGMIGKKYKLASSVKGKLKLES